MLPSVRLYFSVSVVNEKCVCPSRWPRISLHMVRINAFRSAVSCLMLNDLAWFNASRVRLHSCARLGRLDPPTPPRRRDHTRQRFRRADE